MQRVREGSEDAAKELFDQYGPHIFRVVRRRLDKKLRAKFDSSDFVQSVWASFYAIPRSGQTFDSPEALIAYLAKLARNKIVEVYRQRYGGTKYNINRERSLEGSAAFEAHQVIGKQPTPSQVLGAAEQFDNLAKDLPAYQRGILEMLVQGNTHKEIADKLGFDEKTVRRLIRRIAPEL